MNFLVKSIALAFIIITVSLLLILNIQWGNKKSIPKNIRNQSAENYKQNRTVFVALFELKKNVLSELDKDFKKRKKVRLNYE